MGGRVIGITKLPETARDRHIDADTEIAYAVRCTEIDRNETDGPSDRDWGQR